MAYDVFNNDEREKARKEVIEQAQKEEKQRRINYGLTFSTAEGFEVLRDLQEICHAEAPSYCQGDQYETAFREGERNVFQYIKSKLSTDLRSKLIGG